MESIICKELTFSYPTSEYPVLDSLSLSIDKGELCLLIGESAVGKSTLLRLLKKELAPFGTVSGEIAVSGNVGYVAQNVEESIVADKVRAELSFGLTNMGMSSDEIELLVAETASYFNLENKLDNDISTLSGGEKQMVNLASVMIMKPDVLLLDEPTSQLDPVSASRFVQMIIRLHNDFGITVFMSEHNLDELIMSADSIAYMQKGDLVKSDTDSMIDYLAHNAGDMSNILPAYMRMFDGVRSFVGCKNKLLACSLDDDYETEQTPDVALELKNISFAYKRGEDVINGASLKVYKGKINAVIGPNSSGKSTLLKIASGVKKQYRGRVKADGKIAYLCQNVTDLFTKEKCADEILNDSIVSYFGIEDIMNQHPFDLSGGQAQRLAIAKVLQTGADIILLDEPTKGFDPVLKVKLANLLFDLCSQGKTILIVSHDIEFVGEYADYVSFLSRGKIVATSPRKQFFSSLSFYTTQVSKLTSGIASGVVSFGDLKSKGVL